MKTGRNSLRGFTLIEVVVALGVLAVILVALLGLSGPAARMTSEIADTHATACLVGNLQQELERLQVVVGLDGLAAAIPAAGSDAPLRLVATRDGRRVLCADSPVPAADRALDDEILRGIAQRDRYFLAEVTQQLDLPYAPGAGFLAVGVRLSWPYRLPVGAETPGETRSDGDPSREVPMHERNWVVFNFALRP